MYVEDSLVMLYVIFVNMCFIEIDDKLLLFGRLGIKLLDI